MTGEQARAERFAELFHAVYLTFHRRDRPRSELPGVSRAVLEHLALEQGHVFPAARASADTQQKAMEVRRSDSALRPAA